MEQVSSRVFGVKFLSLFLLVCNLLLSASANAGAPVPSFSKLFSPDTIGAGSVSTLTFTIRNNDGINPVDDLAFIDSLPAGVSIADPANASATCNDSVLSAPDGGTTVTLSDGRVATSSSCVVSVDVTSSTPGTHMNVSGDLTSSAGNSGTASDDLDVVTSLPGFSKSFSPSSVSLGGRSTLTFTIDNTLNTSPVGNLDFTDNLPLGMVVADPPNVSTDCISASAPDTTVTATQGASVIALNADGSTIFPGFEVLPIGDTCTVTVDVIATGSGILDNVSGDLLADFTSAGKASDSLTVTSTPLFIQKSFVDDPVAPGGVVTLDFTLNNFDRNFSATGVAFTDDLTTLVPALAGLTFSSLLSNDCGGSISGTGGATIGLSGATIPAEGSCTISTRLAVPAGATAGVYTNTTGTITGTVNGSPVVGNMASEDLFVEPTPVLTKEFLTVGTLAPDPVVNAGDDVVLRFTITNPSTTSGATDIAFVDELTDGSSGFPPDLTTGFLPFPVSVTLPPVPNPPCGAGSSLGFVFPDTERQGLSLTGGSLAASGSCTFDVVVTIPADLVSGIYTNTTEQPTATIDGATRTGKEASDTLTVIAAPSLTKAFSDDPVAPGGTVTLEFTLNHSANATGDATGISFTDDLASLTPALAGLVATGLPLTDVCGLGNGTLTGSAGDTLLTFMGATLNPGESCTFSVTLDVPASASAGSYTNTTSGVMAAVDGSTATSASASDDLTVSGLEFTKEFLTNPILPGDTTNLRFTIENLHPTEDATITFFTDNLQAELSGLAATGAPATNTCGGTLSGTTFLTYTGGNVSSGATCTIEVPVLVPAGAANGNYANITSSLSATQGVPVTVNPASDILTVNDNLIQLDKSFTDDPVSPGNSVTLEFTITNLDPNNVASDIAFTNDLGAALSGLTFDSIASDSCSGTVAGTGTDMIDISGVSLAASASCALQVSLTIPGGAAANIYTNTTSAVTGAIDGFAVTGDAASDNLEVINQLVFSKYFDGPSAATNTATLTFSITNPGTDAAMGIAFSDDLDAVLTGLVATNLPLTDVCGVGSSITGTSFLTFTAGELPPMGGMCSFDVEVLVPATATAGTFPNTTSDLSQSGIVVSPPATADLTIEPPPAFSKGFAPATVGLNGPNTISTLTLTVDNIASALDATALNVTDNLPAGMEIATPANASTTCIGGTLTATSGTAVLSYTGGTANTGTSCTINVDVISTTSGNKVNTTEDLTSSLGNSGTATDTLTVDTPPVITAPADILNFEATGVTSSVALGTPTIIDDIDAGLNAIPSPDGSALPLGTSTITWTVLDPIGNTSTATQTVTVVDTTNPIITPPVNINIEATATLTPVTLGSASVADDVSSGLTATPNNLGPFPVGTTIVTWSATDGAGNTGTVTQSVTVTDNTGPVVTPPGDITQEATAALSPVTLGNATVSDAVTSGLSASPDNFGPFPVGSTTITWSATDAAGNVGTAIQTVIITDNTQPNIMLNGDSTVTLDFGDVFTDSGATASDIVDGDLTNSIIVSGTVGTAPGSYILTYSVTDNAGNTANVVRTVIIGTVRTFSELLPSGTTGTLSFNSTDQGCTFNTQAFIDVSDASISPPASLSFVDGLIAFEIVNCSVGATVNITMDYGQPLPPKATYWKEGTPWYQLPATISGNTVTFSITDGQLGDTDESENGIIRDPSGLALFSQHAIPTLSNWALFVLIILMLTSMTYYNRRRKF